MNGQNGQVDLPDTAHRVTGVPTTRAAHAVRPVSPARVVGFGAAVAAVAAAAALGVAAVLHDSGPTHSSPTSAQLMTVTPSPFPMTREELLVLDGADFGPLADPTRRDACLQGLGYPQPVDVRGARQVDIGGRPAVVMVLSGARTGELVALAVRPECSGSAPRLVVDTTVTSP